MRSARGSLFFVPPHTSHSFIDTAGYKPLCLALDLDWKNPARTAPAFSTLTLLDLKRVRQELAHLTRWRTGAETVEPREAAAVLRLIDVCFRSLGLLTADSLPVGSHLFKSVQRILHEPASWREPLGAIARRVGYQPDYLNRMLKQVCGLTLGELRDTIRLRTARRLLAQPMSDVGGRGGRGGFRRSQLLLPLVSRADGLYSQRLARRAPRHSRPDKKKSAPC